MGAILQSPYPLRECEERLAASVEKPWSFFSGLPVAGEVGNGSATLRKKNWYRNSFQTVLRVRLISVADGTQLRCDAGMSLVVVIFLIFWFSVVTLIGGLMAMVAIMNGDWNEALFPLFLLGGGLGIVGFGRRLARDEERYLTDYVGNAVDARVVAMTRPC
jgi:hypothetical protein